MCGKQQDGTIDGRWVWVMRLLNLSAEATNEVIADPNRFSTLTHGVRYARVQRFPYLVLFELEDEELRVLGVLHTARSIEKWRDQRME